MKDIVERLRERTISIPKPGTKPFQPHGPITTTIGGPPKKPGEDLGVSSVYSPIPNQWLVQEHICAIEPLCAEAADEIERLRSKCGYAYRESASSEE